jgi:hypothetical protein
MKLDLLTNATVVDDAIRFISQKSNDKEKLKSSSESNNQNDKESNEPDYDEDKDQLEEETGEMTTNPVFSHMNKRRNYLLFLIYASILSNIYLADASPTVRTNSALEII